jgi:DNA-directed RNA polymerase subunit RPC12/RpoP
MNYYLCPRCKFKIASNKYLCTTCGFKIPSSSGTKSGGKEASPKESTKQAFLGRLFNNLEKANGKKTDTAQEKPAPASS